MGSNEPIVNPISVKKKRWPIILVLLFVILLGVSMFVYLNLTRLLSSALSKSFDKSLVSDVYELKFDNLYVNIFDGDIRISKVVFQPRSKPLNNYPYINSAFSLSTDKLILKNVKIKQLLQTQTLELDKIEIDKPEIQLSLAGDVHVFFPFNDSTSDIGKNEKKKSVQAFHLQKFELNNANFNATNSFEQREFEIKNVNFTFNDLFLNQHVGMDSLSCKSIELSIESFAGRLLKSPVRTIQFRNYNFNVENVELQKTIDTVIFHFDDFNTSLNDLDINTADSIFHLSMKKFGLSYRDKSIKLEDIVFEPNISESQMQKRFKYQNTQFAASIGSLEIVKMEFDSLIKTKKFVIQELILDSVTAAIFKDKTKPMDLTRFPLYPGQQIAGLKVPVQISRVTVKNSTIVNRERKPDGTYAKVTVNNLQAIASNITNLSTVEPLVVKGAATLENSAPFNVTLKFDYTKPQFSIDAKISKFNLKSLNTLLKSYSPASINSGVVDEISFSGTAFHSSAKGHLKFLYHDLSIDLQLHEQAKWKSTLGAFAANTYLHSANPVTPGHPERVVSYEAQRDMHKGFINIVLKSLLSGLKETMIMSKENRKAFQEVKRKERSKNKKEK